MPPGTQWLRTARQRVPTKEEQAQIQKVSDNAPELGSWQFTISPFGETWNVLKSAPERSDWHMHSTHYDLGDALRMIQNLRANPQ